MSVSATEDISGMELLMEEISNVMMVTLTIKMDAPVHAQLKSLVLSLVAVSWQASL